MCECEFTPDRGLIEHAVRVHQDCRGKTWSGYGDPTHRIGVEGDLFDLDSQVKQDSTHIDIALLNRNSDFLPNFFGKVVTFLVCQYSPHGLPSGGRPKAVIPRADAPAKVKLTSQAGKSRRRQ